ncbi:amidase [bacterium]|nr:amidase [bacterium]
MNKKDSCHAFVPGEMRPVSPHKPGLLSPMTFAVKELYDVKGFVTGAGNSRWKKTHPVASQTAPAVESLLNEGATLIGKTISDEMAFSLDGENVHYGTPLNTRCPERIPGGSSSGSAAAVAGGMVDFALGTDTAGSIRVPASHCGIFGFRPTHGAIPTAGIHPMSPSFDVVGWFAGSPEVLKTVGSVLLKTDIPEIQLETLSVPVDVMDWLSPPVRRCFNDMIKGLGIKTADIDLSRGQPAAWMEVLRNIQWWELNSAHGPWIEQNMDSFGEEIRGRLKNISSVSQNDMEKSRARKQEFERHLDRLIRADTIVVLPTVHEPAPLKGQAITEARAYRAEAMKMTCFATVGGLPQVSMPLMEHDGCPLGISLLGARGQDARLLAAADCCSRMSGFSA